MHEFHLGDIVRHEGKEGIVVKVRDCLIGIVLRSPLEHYVYWNVRKDGGWKPLAEEELSTVRFRDRLLECETAYEHRHIKYIDAKGCEVVDFQRRQSLEISPGNTKMQQAMKESRNSSDCLLWYIVAVVVEDNIMGYCFFEDNVTCLHLTQLQLTRIPDAWSENLCNLMKAAPLVSFWDAVYGAITSRILYCHSQCHTSIEKDNDNPGEIPKPIQISPSLYGCHGSAIATFYDIRDIRSSLEISFQQLQDYCRQRWKAHCFAWYRHKHPLKRLSPEIIAEILRSYLIRELQ